MSKDLKKYRSIKVEEEVYHKLQYLKRKHKASSISEVIDKLTEDK